MQQETVVVDRTCYHLLFNRRTTAPPAAPRLAVVSYLPNQQAARILQCCLRAVQQFTPQPHELWVIDNNSPERHKRWLRTYPGINLVLNTTSPMPRESGFSLGRLWRRLRRRPPRYGGSYANGVALELAAKLISADSQRLMTLHMDTMPCHPRWLTFLQGKVQEKVAAAAVRMDRGRTRAGVLHVLGMLLNFAVFRQLGLTFMPQMPRHDVGDRVTLGLRAHGYGVFACRNTLWEPELATQIPPSSPLRHLPVDRSFDDAGNVIFLHLGRGVQKSGQHASGRGLTAAEWIAFAEEAILSPSAPDEAPGTHQA